MLFIAIDGDDVGRRIEYLVLLNKTNALLQFSLQYQEGMTWLENILVEKLNAQIVFNGGDNLLATIPSNSNLLEEIEKIRTKFEEQTQTTLSIGIGNTPRESYFALKLAKNSGKDRVCEYKDFSNG